MVNSVLEEPNASVFSVVTPYGRWLLLPLSSRQIKAAGSSRASRRLQWIFCHHENLKFYIVFTYTVIYCSMEFLMSIYLTGVLLCIARCVITENVT
jgi:hypothetical protein